MGPARTPADPAQGDHAASRTGHDACGEGPSPAPDARRREGRGDLLVAAALALAAPVAMHFLSAEAHLRLLLVGPILLVVPGYLLLAALFVPRPPRMKRASSMVVAVAATPPLVAVLALATALVPGGFKPYIIAAVLTLACLGLAYVAHRRRAAWERAAEGAHEEGQGPVRAPDAAVEGEAFAPRTEHVEATERTPWRVPPWWPTGRPVQPQASTSGTDPTARGSEN